MTRRRVSTTKIPWNALFDWKNANLGAFMLGVFYLIFPWMTSGVLDEGMAIFGLMFLTISIMRAKGSNTVIGGLMSGFIGVIYLCAIGGVVNMATLWMFTLIFAAIFFIFEMGIFKIGPISKKADAFQIVPFTLMTFALLLSMTGYSTIFIIDWSGNIIVALNYLAVFLFCALSMLQLAGWNVAGTDAKTNKWIMLFAVVAIAVAVFGTFQGTLWQWT